MNQGCGAFLLILGCGCGEGADYRSGAGPGFRFFYFCLQKNIMNIKILNSIKSILTSVESLSNV